MDDLSIIASWLHISDLHVFSESDTVLILEDYLKLSKVISPEFIVISGDFRHLKYKTEFSSAEMFLESIIDTFSVEKENTFIVPGNHDVNSYLGRDKAISDICINCNKDYNAYYQYIKGEDNLYKGFYEYGEFIHRFYNGSNVFDDRTLNPSGVYSIVWNNMINVLSINTALISNGEKHDQILDLKALTECKINPNFPTIMIGHHGIDSLYQSHRERIETIIDRRDISVFMHGDIHKYANNPIQKISTPNKSVPSIACGKSAPQSGDIYSDIGVVYYEWKNDNNVYIQAYKWSTKGFIENSAYYYDINKRYSFPMLFSNNAIEKRKTNIVKMLKYLAKNDPERFMIGDWISEAEYVWNLDKNEVVGRSLLLYYYKKTKSGDSSFFSKAKDFYNDLKLIRNCEAKTNQMLNQTRDLFDFDVS